MKRRFAWFFTALFVGIVLYACGGGGSEEDELLGQIEDARREDFELSGNRGARAKPIPLGEEAPIGYGWHVRLVTVDTDWVHGGMFCGERSASERRLLVKVEARNTSNVLPAFSRDRLLLMDARGGRYGQALSPCHPREQGPAGRVVEYALFPLPRSVSLDGLLIFISDSPGKGGAPYFEVRGEPGVFSGSRVPTPPGARGGSVPTLPGSAVTPRAGATGGATQAAATARTTSPAATPTVSASQATVWQVSEAHMREIAACLPSGSGIVTGPQSAGQRSCVESAMTRNGASESAVTVFRVTNQFLVGFNEAGTVDVGHVTAPWVNMGRATLVFLHAGRVTPVAQLFTTDWTRDPSYRGFGSVSAWWEYARLTGSRTSSAGQQIEFEVPLRTCRACDDAAYLRVSFGFDREGMPTGTTVMPPR